jgi:hypothetical protein
MSNKNKNGPRFNNGSSSIIGGMNQQIERVGNNLTNNG